MANLLIPDSWQSKLTQLVATASRLPES